MRKSLWICISIYIHVDSVPLLMCNPSGIMLLLQMCFHFFLLSCIRGFQINSTSISLCCLSLAGFRIKTELHSRTVLDSRGRDYPPWSFYRQEIVQCKTLPEGLATSVLTDCVLACIREEKGNGFIPFDPPLDFGKRGIWGAHTAHIRPVTTQICSLEKKGRKRNKVLHTAMSQAYG